MRRLLFLCFSATALHANAQLGEQLRRMLNGDPDAPPAYDTNYVASYRSNLTLSLLTKYQSVDVDIEQDEGQSLSFSANTTEQYGMGLNYKWLSAEFTFTVPALDDYDPALGKSTSRGFGLGYTGRRLWARGFWNKTSGYYLNDPGSWVAGWEEGDRPVTRGDLASETYMLSANYALSGKKRFSQNAALFQQERQKRSAGTFVLGFSGWRSFVSADSSILSPALVDTFQLATGFRSVERSLIGLTVGYTHTFSLWHKGFIHAAILPGLGYVHQSINTSSTEELTGTGVGAVTEFKLGAGYNGDRWYTALTTAFYYSTTPIAEHLNLSTNYGFVRFAIGIRLGAPGISGLQKVGL
ncbi:MAG: DUF4421 family protein [Flavobacteriales bacterium]|nr:DUF4421 family protein [Flavobacteriales bacterium]